MHIDWDRVEKVIKDLGFKEYPLEECTFGERLGCGVVMEVFQGKCAQIASQDVVFKRHRDLKVSRLIRRDIEKIVQSFQHEISLMKRLKYSANVVQVYGVTFEKKKPILIVELGNETLDIYLRDKAEAGSPAAWHEKLKLCEDVSRGIRSLHDADIIHGNIKGENVLVFVNPAGIPTAKLSDFGHSSKLTTPKGNIYGTRIFIAPEVRGSYYELSTWEKNPTQDIFSFGLVTYLIANDGIAPYEDTDEISKIDPTNRHTGLMLANLPPDTPDVFPTIIVKTTKYLPAERASLDIVDQILYDFRNSLPSQITSKNTSHSPFEDMSTEPHRPQLPHQSSLTSRIISHYSPLHLGRSS